MLARFIEQEASRGSDYYHAVLRGLQPGLAYTVDHIKDYGWYKSVYLVGFDGGFNSELFTLHEVDA